jgi:sarcosine oxidase subunit beta
MKNNFDVIIIGGGIIGLATGYYLSQAGQQILVLEKDYLGAGSTGRCITGIRAQFSTEATIRLAMTSVDLFENMKHEFGFSVDWYPSGYLFLAYDEAHVNSFLEVMALQRRFGLDVQYLEPKQISELVPMMNTEALLGGTYCPTDGQADPFLVLKGYYLGLKRYGATILTYTKACSIDIKNGSFQVYTSNGEVYKARQVLNAAGPWAKKVGKMVDLDLPVEPERHEALITEGVAPMYIPMLVDYRDDGCYFVQRLTGQFIGCYTPKPNVPGKRLDSSFNFMTEMPRRMLRLMPALGNIAVLRQWAGSYCMTPDGNPILDETSVPGFYVLVGMSGHGFMLGPALGKFMAEFMITGEWPFDMNEFAFGRDFEEYEEAMK